MIADRELRQLGLVEERLGSYRSGELSLAGLVKALDALWNQFSLASRDWLDEFRSHWWTLEQVHAVVLDRELSDVPDDLQVLVEEAVDQLGFLVDQHVAVAPPVGGDRQSDTAPDSCC